MMVRKSARSEAYFWVRRNDEGCSAGATSGFFTKSSGSDSTGHEGLYELVAPMVFDKHPDFIDIYKQTSEIS